MDFVFCEYFLMEARDCLEGMWDEVEGDVHEIDIVVFSALISGTLWQLWNSCHFPLVSQICRLDGRMAKSSWDRHWIYRMDF